MKGATILVPEGHDTLPVMAISWKDAEAYCAWLSRRDPTATYRLPTVAEWEKAASGADGRTYPWGNHFDYAFTKGGRSREGKAAPEPVGSFPADESPYVVRDLAGGVREWCDDWYNPEQSMKCMRGSAWSTLDEAGFRIATQFAGPPQAVSSSVGFRVVRAPR
jgi:serine/threonine-protein kinase